MSHQPEKNGYFFQWASLKITPPITQGTSGWIMESAEHAQQKFIRSWWNKAGKNVVKVAFISCGHYRCIALAEWHCEIFTVSILFWPPYCFKCILLVNWIMISVLSCSNKKNKLILCSWVCFIITLVWHSRLLVCVSLAPGRCSLLGKTLRLTVSVYLTPTNVFGCKARAAWDRCHL